MKLVLFDAHQPGVLKDGGVVDIGARVPRERTGQETIQTIIKEFESLRSGIEREVEEGKVIPLSQVRLRAPLPRPSNILAMAGNYKEHGGRPPAPISVFFKSPESVLDPGGSVVLPSIEFPICHHEAELGLVIGPRKAKDVSQSQAYDYIFGYTAAVDVSARNSVPGFMHKCFDTFTPMGPCIVTRDEIPNAQNLHVQLRVNGEVRHDYNTDDMLNQIPRIMEYVTMIMTLNPGDLVICGTNHEGLGPLQDGDSAEMEIDAIGKFSFTVRDPMKRKWYNSTDVEAEKQGITPRQQLVR